MSEVAPPIALLCELTHRCPLKCPYCSNPVELARRREELETETWLDVFRQAAHLGVLQVHLSGGEPAARGDLEALVAGAVQAELYTNLITSGVSLSGERLSALAEAGLDHVQLSLQGASAAKGDYIGGLTGGHRRKLFFAEEVRRIGLPLTVNAVVHRQNLDELQDLIDLSLEMGAARLEVAHVQYYGWALENRAALMPTRAQLETATEIVSAARTAHHGVLRIDYVPPDYYARRPKPCMGGWGRQALVITPKGRVLPCHAAETLPRLTFPSVKEMSLGDIWRKSSAFNAYRGTDWMPSPCRTCPERQRDWGGCRCQAFALTGDAGATDPACDRSSDHALLGEVARKDADGPIRFTYRGF